MKVKEFIQKAKSIHGNKYDYSLVKYKNCLTKIIIICRKHRLQFEQEPRAHLAGQGCWKCAGRTQNQHIPLTTQEFIRRAKKIHGDKYGYEETEYVNSRTKIAVFCKKHICKFEQIAGAHLEGKGCPKCGLERSTAPTIDKDVFIQKAKKLHKNRYDYSEVIYTTYKKKVKIICKKCSKKDNAEWIFCQSPNAHLQGHGCPRCGNIRNELERSWLDSIGIPDNIESRQVTLKVAKNKHVIVDGLDPLTKTVYEFYGDYFHGNPNIYGAHDYNKLCKKTFGELHQKTMEKERLIKKAGFKLISIWESDFLQSKKRT